MQSLRSGATPRRAAVTTGIAAILALAAPAAHAQEEPKKPRASGLDLVRERLARTTLTAFEELRGVYIHGRAVGKATESLALEEREGRKVGVHKVEISLRTRGESFKAGGTSVFDAATLEPIEATRTIVRSGLSRTFALAREGDAVVYTMAAGKTAPREIQRLVYDPKVLYVESLLYVISRHIGLDRAGMPGALRLKARGADGAPISIQMAISRAPVPTRYRGEERKAYRIAIGRQFEAADGSEMLFVDETGRLLVQSTDAGASTPGGQEAIVTVFAEDESQTQGLLEPPIAATKKFDASTPEGAAAKFHDALLRGDVMVAESLAELRTMHKEAGRRLEERGIKLSEHFPSYDAWRSDVLDDWLSLRGRKDAVPDPEAALEPEAIPPDKVRIRALVKPVTRIYVLQKFDATWRIVDLYDERKDEKE